MAGSAGRKLDPKWLGSVDKYPNWKVVGFTSNSLVPIIDLLDADLRDQCKAVLRNYLVGSLILKDTERVGNPSNAVIEPSESVIGTDGNSGSFVWGVFPFYDPVRFEEPIKSIKVTWGGRVCGIKTKRLTLDGKPIVYDPNLPRPPKMPGEVYEWFFNSGTTENGTSVEGLAEHHVSGSEAEFSLDKDEEIESVEVGLVGEHQLVNHLVFMTTKGRRYPSSGQFGGSDSTVLKQLTAPRIRGFAGTYAWGMHNFGLRYFDLSDRAMSRTFLRLTEGYLFV